jgi:hypothetical protein
MIEEDAAPPASGKFKSDFSKMMIRIETGACGKETRLIK